MSNLILPGHPAFNAILASVPPPDLIGNAETGLSYVIGIDGIPRAANSEKDLDEYLLGGEYDEVLSQEDDEDLDWIYLYL